MRRLVLVLGTLTACSFNQSGVGGIDAKPGSADARIDAGVDANTCGVCSGNVLKGCQGAADQICDLGCSMVNGAHCKQIVPSNGVPVSALNGAVSALTTMSAVSINTKREYTIDTDTGEIFDYGVDGFPTNTTPTQIRTPGTGVMNGMNFTMVGAVSVLAVDSVHIGADSVLYGFGSRPLVVLSRGDVLIEGDVDFSAGCYDAGQNFIYSCAGPGGGVGANGGIVTAGGCGPGANGAANHFTGGGGGGAGASGGSGGDFSNGNKGGAGGTATACAGASLDPINGGGGGGQGGADQGGDGGGGGGAIQFTSLKTITLSHPISASNQTQIYVGGQGGRGAPLTNSGGGGGGAGGGVLLEAPSVNVHAIVSANGGGGGGGRITGATADGGEGTTTLMQAAGGVGDGAGGNTGRGGFGGAVGGGASQGSGPANMDGTGGGGGAAGRVRLNSLTGVADTTAAVISPAASQGTIKTQ